jgi:hypothetical protein
VAARGLQPTTLVSSGEGSGQVMMDRSVDIDTMEYMRMQQVTGTV